MKQIILIAILFYSCHFADGQVKILFDATKAETAGNADWIIDADAFNLNYSNGPATVGGGTEANGQTTPTPMQSNITTSTAETFWKGGLSYWAIDCVKKGYQVATLPYNGAISYGNVSNSQDLTHYNIFVVDEPNILFTTTEKVALITFVQNGGSLFIISDHTQSDRNNDGHDSPEIWNDLFSNNGIVNNPFGIAFDLATFSGTSSNLSTYASDSLLHGSNGNVSQVLWSSGTSMTIDPAKNPSVKAAVYKTGSSNTGTTKVMVAYARYGLGKVVAVGDSSPFDDGSGDNNDQLYDGYITDANGNHQKLIMNATEWLAANSTILAGEIDFNCYRNGKSVNIDWHTSTDVGISYFNLQKSYNGQDFFNLNFIKATGNSKYAMVDNDLSAKGYIYYRVETIDNDGSKKHSKTVAIKGAGFNQITCYPNPATGVISFSDRAIRQVAVRSVLGNVVLTSSSITNGQLNISSLKAGIYFIEMTSANGSVSTERLLKL